MNTFELTPAQQNIADMMSFYGSRIATLCGAALADGRLDTDTVCEALGILVGRHEAFGLRFRTQGGKTVQYFAQPSFSFPCMSFDDEGQLREWCRSRAHEAFETDGGEMFEIAVLCLPDRTGVMLKVSHLIADGASFALLAREFFDIYQTLERGETVPDECRSFTALTERTVSRSRDTEWWKARYADGFEPCPVSVKRSAEPCAERYETLLGSGLTAAEKTFCAENGVSPATLAECAMLVYLARINGAAATIGVPVSGRATLAEKRTAGMFALSLPLTVTVDPNETAAGLCRRVSALKRGLFMHGSLSYRGIRDCVGTDGRLFDVTVSFRPAPDVPARAEQFFCGCLEVPLAVHTDGSTLVLDHRTDVFNRDEAALLSERLLHILRGLTAGGRVGDITILPEAERVLTVSRFNETAAHFRDTCVHTAFEEQAAARPDRTAVIFRGEEFSYKRIDEMSDSLTAFLRGRGVGRGSIVPLIMRRSPLVIVAMLAVMKAGGAYLPISPECPGSRQRYMVGTVGAKLVLTLGCEYIHAETLDLGSFGFPHAEKPANVNGSGDLCYAVFTSGSTGRPKAAAVTHRSVMNYCTRSARNVLGGIIGSEKSRIVSVTDIVFDIFVTETLLPLTNGMTVVLADEQQSVSQSALSQLVRDSGADIIQTTPTKMRGFLLGHDTGFLSGMSVIMLGGEELPAPLAHKLRGLTKARIFNIYGPAETTVWSSFAEVTEGDITIGQPIANTRIYLLDDGGSPVPVGVRGEIYIAGEGVGTGYVGEETLTAESFLPDPFFGGRMYRTGDMGLRRTDGNIVFLGRRGGFVKLRGQRIQPLETECAMCGFEGITLAAVTLRTNPAGEQYLAGHYTSQTTIDERELRSYLMKMLPACLVPNRFMRLERMPLTPGGKLDRNALPEPPCGSGASYTAPANESERRLCALAAEVLSVDAVGTDDDFFERGGDSFSAMAFAAAASEKGFGFTVADVYELRCVKKLCSANSPAPDETALRRRYCRYPLVRTRSDSLLFEAFMRFTRRVYGFTVRGRERLHAGERYIFCPNHASDLDCMWVWAALSDFAELDDCFALIAAEHLDKPLSARIFRIEGGIPVERRGDFMPALRRASALLKKRGGYLLIHPEGTRTRTGSLGGFRRGAALLAIRTGVKLVPVYICGSGRIYPVGRALPKLFGAEGERLPLSVTFGDPIDPAGRTAAELTEELRRRVEELAK